MRRQEWRRGTHDCVRYAEIHRSRPALDGPVAVHWIPRERDWDVRAVTNVRDLVTFRRFMALLASRHGQILNKTDLFHLVRELR
jgi:hypothetical protein